MYYILYAIVLSIILFMVIQYVEKNKRTGTDDEYDINIHLFTMNNLVVFFMILLLNTIIFYYTLDNNDDIMGVFGIGDILKENTKKEIKIKNSSKIDPTILKRINDPIKHGFEPMSDNEKSDNIYDNSDTSDGSSYESDGSDVSSIHVKKSKK